MRFHWLFLALGGAHVAAAQERTTSVTLPGTVFLLPAPVSTSEVTVHATTSPTTAPSRQSVSGNANSLASEGLTNSASLSAPGAQVVELRIDEHDAPSVGDSTKATPSGTHAAETQTLERLSLGPDARFRLRADSPLLARLKKAGTTGTYVVYYGLDGKR